MENIMKNNTNYSLTSYGIICYKKFNNKYKTILIRRKNTIGYVEFLRGKYDIDNKDYIITLFDYMTMKEKENIIKIQNFDKLRNLLGMSKKNNIYKNEYERANKKFYILKNNQGELNLINLIKQSKTNWQETEWGIPKGRKQNKEIDLNCAIREFLEETNLNIKDIKILFNVKPIIEQYTSINEVNYKHIYYFANYVGEDNNLSIDPKNKNQTSEINAIEWFDNKESQNKIRPYYIEKKEILNKAYEILNNLENYEN